MNDFSIYVGERIKIFRKLRKMSLDKLAQNICKSKSTVSKYEHGKVLVDIETLENIANALNTEPYQLLYQDLKTEKKTDFSNFPEETVLFKDSKKLYVYYRDPYKKKIVKGLLMLLTDEATNESKVLYYLDIPSFEKYQEGKYFHSGRMVTYATLTYFLLNNHHNCNEITSICVLHALSSTTFFYGLSTGLMATSLVPVAYKIVLSKMPFESDNEVFNYLTLSKNDLNNIKDTSMFILYNR